MVHSYGSFGTLCIICINMAVKTYKHIKHYGSRFGLYDSGLAGGHFMSQLKNGLDRLCQRRACHLSNATHSLGLLSELHISSHLGKLKILAG